MSCFSASVNTAIVAEPDPAKHVNYNLGMVLGVDDFTQEFAYLSGRDQWLAHDLIGYGSVRGLKVGIEIDAEKGPRAVVEPGVAVSPRGQMICVPQAQCAYLRDSVTSRSKELQDHLTSPLSNAVKLHIVLCYRDCPTDSVPIAGEPCRSEDQLTAPSRLTDDFMLELRFKAPNQREEDAVRDFVDWLKQIQVSDAIISSTPLDQFLEAIRSSAKQWLTSPPTSPPGDFMFGSPPGFLQIQSADAGKYLRAAFRVWATELRPKWIARWHGCTATHFPLDDQTVEDCLLLAELTVPIVPTSPGSWTVADSPAVVINEERRPYVVHLRMLQEWLLGGVARSGLSGLPGPLATFEIKVTTVPAGAVTLTSLHQCVVCDTTAGNVVINLPTTTGNHGRVFLIKRHTAGNNCTVNSDASDSIDGVASVSLGAANMFIQIVGNQQLKTWHVVGSG